MPLRQREKESGFRAEAKTEAKTKTEAEAKTETKLFHDKTPERG